MTVSVKSKHIFKSRGEQAIQIFIRDVGVKRKLEIHVVG